MVLSQVSALVPIEASTEGYLRILWSMKVSTESQSMSSPHRWGMNPRRLSIGRLSDSASGEHVCWVRYLRCVQAAMKRHVCAVCATVGMRLPAEFVPAVDGIGVVRREEGLRLLSLRRREIRIRVALVERCRGAVVSKAQPNCQLALCHMSRPRPSEWRA